MIDLKQITMISVDLSVLEKALDKYGIRSQYLMLQEECMELASAIHKFETRSSSKENREKIYDELADVIIMIEQVKLTDFDFDLLQERINYKLNKLNKRINGDERVFTEN